MKLLFWGKIRTGSKKYFVAGDCKTKKNIDDNTVQMIGNFLVYLIMIELLTQIRGSQREIRSRFVSAYLTIGYIHCREMRIPKFFGFKCSDTILFHVFDHFFYIHTMRLYKSL